MLSSHIFHEIDATCDKISIIKDGRIVSDFNPTQLRNESDKIFRITFKNKKFFDKFVSQKYLISSVNENKLRARVRLKSDELSDLIKVISTLDVKEFQEFPFTLEAYFMQFYKEDKIFEGVKQ